MTIDLILFLIIALVAVATALGMLLSRTFVLKLNDGIYHRINFKFKK